MKRMFRLVGGTEREDVMVGSLSKRTELTLHGAHVIVQALKLSRTNMERFTILVQYLSAEAARDWLQRYDFT